MNAHAHTHTHAYIHIHIFTYMHTCSIHTHIHTYNIHSFIHTDIHSCMYTYILHLPVLPQQLVQESTDFMKRENEPAFIFGPGKLQGKLLKRGNILRLFFFMEISSQLVSYKRSPPWGQHHTIDGKPLWEKKWRFSYNNTMSAKNSHCTVK